MIKTEIIKGKFIRHYSDNGSDLRQVETGNVYSEAVDLIPCNYTYQEVESLEIMEEGAV